MAPVIAPKQLDVYSSQITDLYAALEENIFMLIAKRLVQGSDVPDSDVLYWQARQLQQLNALNLETIQELSKVTGLSVSEIRGLFSKVGYDTILAIDEEVRIQSKGKIKQLPMPNDLDERLGAYVRQVFLDIDNLVNETLITTSLGEGSAAYAYRKIVQEATGMVIAGQKTIQEALTDTVIKYADAGLMSGFVDKSGRRWNIQSYTKTVIKSTVNNAYNQLRIERMDEYGLEFVRVSVKSSARPTCARCQGKVLSMKQVSSLPEYGSVYDYGYGEPSGVRGINCGHFFTIFIPGTSINTSNPPEVEAADEKFRLTQEQRYLERSIRQSKRNLQLAEITGDQRNIDKYKKQVRARQAKIREFVDQNNLPRFYENEQNIV